MYLLTTPKRAFFAAQKKTHSNLITLTAPNIS